MHSTSQRSFPSENERVVSGMKEIGLPIQATGDSGRDSRQPMEVNGCFSTSENERMELENRVYPTYLLD